jgi:hypothetical protein
LNLAPLKHEEMIDPPFEIPKPPRSRRHDGFEAALSVRRQRGAMKKGWWLEVKR